MRQRPRFLLAAAILGLSSLSAAAVSCGSNGNGQTGAGAGTGTGGAGGTSSTGTGNKGTGGGLFGSDGGCLSAADCNGGVCVGGACCPSASDVCGSECCTGGTVCLFDKCVTPGKDCHTANDCATGQYCETALGSQPDGGTADGGVFADGGADGGVCSQPLPLEGKCLDLPPVCAADAGADAGNCVADCQFHPKAGKLNAVQRWAWGPTATAYPNFTDVWATPTVGRVHDSNCDGKIDELDAPVIVFVSGKALDANGIGTCCQCNGTTPTACHTGVLRMLDGLTGQEIWSLHQASASSAGFAGMSTALGDIDGDGRADVVAVTGEGYVVLIDGDGTVKEQSDKAIPGGTGSSFGWGGGLAIADMDGDGSPEIAYGATVFSTTGGKITLKFTGTAGTAGPSDESLSTLADVDLAPDNHLELVAGNTAYKADGTILWHNTSVGNGFPGIGDFNQDGKPDVAVVAGGHLWILNGLDGTVLIGGAAGTAIPGTGSGGPPTIADFDGDGKPEVGVAMATFYAVMKPDFTTNTIKVLWQTQNHDLSSSVTGSTVFDFEGDGKAEVIYADECFLWVFDGTDGSVRFAAPHTSFTGTEASLVADVDGDGRAEIVMVTNAADPSNAGWKCMDASGNGVTMNGVKWTPSSLPSKAYRGIVVFGDSASSWVGTRTLWNEHTYHVSNICDDRDSACTAPNVYGSIPKVEQWNWKVPWLNNFRQNVQDKGLFDAPDATVSLSVACSAPAVLTVSVRNIGLASLPAGVDVGIYKGMVSMTTQIGTVTTTHALFPGQTEQLSFTVPAGVGADTDTYVAQVLNDPKMPKFNECRTDNDTSDPATAHCSQ